MQLAGPCHRFPGLALTRICPSCERAVRLRLDGKTVAHKTDASHCRGSGGQPADAAPLACWLPAKKGLTPHGLRHSHKTWMEVSGVAAAASFGRSGERALPAVQRTALEQARSHGSPCTQRDLGCHHPLASSSTMMQPVRLQQIPA